MLQCWYLPSNTTSTIFWCFYCISSDMFRPLIWPSSGYLNTSAYVKVQHCEHRVRDTRNTTGNSEEHHHQHNTSARGKYETSSYISKKT
jgi:hypothetical protein